jgi:alkaline phosphatase
MKKVRLKVSITLSLIITLSISAPVLAGNVILIIGDGMDDQQISIARNYLVGTTGKLSLDNLPV